jgi:hypothetical protein
MPNEEDEEEQDFVDTIDDQRETETVPNVEHCIHQT